VALCRRCHAQTDAPYGRRRLVITAGGSGRFRFEEFAAPTVNAAVPCS